MLYLFSAGSVLWIVLGSTVLFVAAPHLEIASKAAARTLRIGAVLALLQLVVPFLYRFIPYESGVGAAIGPLCTAAFFGSIAMAGWQMVQEAPKKGGLL